MTFGSFIFAVLNKTLYHDFRTKQRVLAEIFVSAPSVAYRYTCQGPPLFVPHQAGNPFAVCAGLAATSNLLAQSANPAPKACCDSAANKSLR